MFPHLFSVGGYKVDTYYILWTLALMLMVVYTRQRAVRRFGILYNDATDVLFYVFVGGILGAVFGGYLSNLSLYIENPKALLNYRIVGLSSATGILFAGLMGLWKLKKLHCNVNAFADSSSVPVAFMLAIGRLGCFSAGCCYGISTKSILGVHFHNLSSGVYVYPTQLFESTGAFVIALILLGYERYKLQTNMGLLQGNLFSLFMIGYGGYRFIMDSLRDETVFFGLRTGQISGFFALVLGVFWLYASVRKGLRYPTVSHRV